MSVLAQPSTILRWMLFAGMVTLLGLDAVILLGGGALSGLVLPTICVGVILVCWVLLRLGKVALAADLMCGNVWLGAMLGSALSGGVYSPQIFALVIFLVLVGIFRGAAALPVAGFLVLMSVLALGMISTESAELATLMELAVSFIGVGTATGIALGLTMSRLSAVLKEAAEANILVRQQEASLAEQSALLEALGWGIPGGIGIVERTTGRILWHSPGWSAEGETLAELFAPQETSEIERILVAGSAPRPLPQGDRWTQVCLSPSEGADRMVIILLDVTEELRIQRALQERTLALNRADRLAAVGRMVGGLCHQIHDAFTMLSHLSWLASLKIPPGGLAYADLAEIKGAVRRASGITRPLLPLADTVAQTREVVGVGALLKETRRMLARLAGRGIWLNLNIETGTHPVEISAGLMEEVLINLVANSREAMEGRGNLEINLSQGEGRVWMEVSDSGVGMDAETLKKCREMFFTTRERGSGLGLAVVDRIVQKAGGRMDMRSTPGVGTTVFMSFPRARTETTHISALPAVTRIGAQRRVLVLDDNDGIRRLVCAVLDRAGFSPVDARSVAEAIALAEARPVDLLISGVVMPDMSGTQLALLLRKRTPKLPVLLITSYAAGALEKTPITDALLLKKPFEPGELIEAVRLSLHPTDQAIRGSSLVVL